MTEFSKNIPKCCIGDVSHVYPSVVSHKGKLWELKFPTSTGKTEPGTPLGNLEWKVFTTKIEKNKYANIKKVLENKRKKSIFELEDGFVRPYGHGGSDASMPLATLYLELETFDPILPERAFFKQIV
jgi:hypothetical protein